MRHLTVGRVVRLETGLVEPALASWHVRLHECAGVDVEHGPGRRARHVGAGLVVVRWDGRELVREAVPNHDALQVDGRVAAGDGLGVVVEDGCGEERDVPPTVRLSGKVERAALEFREGLEEESNESLHVLGSSAERP